MIPEDTQAARTLFAILAEVETATGCEIGINVTHDRWELITPSHTVHLIRFFGANLSAWFARSWDQAAKGRFEVDPYGATMWRETPLEAQRLLTAWIIDQLRGDMLGAQYIPGTRVRWSPRPGFPWEGIVIANPGYVGVDGRWRATVQFGESTMTVDTAELELLAS